MIDFFLLCNYNTCYGGTAVNLHAHYKILDVGMHQDAKVNRWRYTMESFREIWALVYKNCATKVSPSAFNV